jgi:hypothetical protein
MKDYFDYHTTSKLAEAKLKESEVQIAKAEKGTVRKAEQAERVSDVCGWRQVANDK